MAFDFGFALSTVPTILSAIVMTLLVAALSCIGASAIGFGFELVAARAASEPLRRLRDRLHPGNAVLVWLYCLYFILPFYGIRLGALASASSAQPLIQRYISQKCSRPASMPSPMVRPKPQGHWGLADG